MKKLLSILILAAAFLQGCQEVGPTVDIDGKSNLLGDTTYMESSVATPQDRLVVLEEFTGVRCVNCPRAHETIKQLLLAHPGRVLAVGIHTGIFSQPYPDRADFRIEQGNDIEQMLGTAPGYPSGAVNRTLFDGETRIILVDSKWSNYINSELSEPTPVNINLVKVYNPVTRSLDFNATIRFTANESRELFLTAYLAEDNIVEHQLTPAGIDQAYIHKHVARKLITPLSGQPITAPSFTPGRVVIQNFALTVDPAWNPANLKLIVFVHGGGTDKAVLHAAYTTVE